MRKFFDQISIITFCSCLFLVIVSCNDGGDTPGTVTPLSTDSDNKTTVKPEPPAAALIGGTLDTLWMNAADFPANPEKIVFTFTIDANDKLKLHGWKVNNPPPEFTPAPNYQLTNAGQHNGATYGPNMYFGNLVLKQQAVNAIGNLISTGHYTKVLFVPKVANGFITYDIFVGKDSPAPITILVVDPTNEAANPSPPKNYN